MGLRERVRLRTRLRALRADAPQAAGAPAPAAAAEEAPAAAPAAATATAEPESDYDRRLAQESARFAEDLNVHDLPPIFHYWSNKHLLPVLQSFGFNSPDELFANAIAERAARLDRPARVLSMGAGNCDTEVRVARLLLDRGIEDFTLTCMELVPEMLERGRALADAEGVTERMEFVAADINAWTGEGEGYDVIMANQFLHHVVELEQLYDHVLELLAPDGCFVTSDMIGRNGHQRWPEAKDVLDEFWAELPDSYRYHVLLQRQEQEYLDWDCSQQGFEGIRSQDVLPLLDERFGFELFIGFGNVIDPFIDRGFGHHFDPDAEWDREFIDRVQARDDELLDAGVLTPTHVMAIMVADKDVTPRIWRDRTVQSSIRRPDDQRIVPAPAGPATGPGWLRMGAAGRTDAIAKPDVYLPLYESILDGRQDEELFVLELGVWRGDSLAMWRDSLPNATIVGVDLGPPELDLGRRVHLYAANQADPTAIPQIARTHAPEGFDLIVDDASHMAAPTAASLQLLFRDHLKPGGTYVIEDWGTGYMASWPDGSALDPLPDVATLGDAAPDFTMASHQTGMVGLVKRLIDHSSASTVAALGESELREPLAIAEIHIHPGLVLLKKAG